MRTIALSSKTNRDLVGDEFLDPLTGQLPDQRGVKNGSVAGQYHDRPGSGYQHVGFHLRASTKVEGTLCPSVLRTTTMNGRRNGRGHFTQMGLGEAMDEP